MNALYTGSLRIKISYLNVEKFNIVQVVAELKWLTVAFFRMPKFLSFL